VPVTERDAKATPGSTEASAGSSPPSRAGAIMCNVAGWLFLLAGLYFLIVAPGMPMADDMADTLAAFRVVNFQRLAMGQAFTVAGAIFLAAAWRK
jgi:hypothetical protein